MSQIQDTSGQDRVIVRTGLRPRVAILAAVGISLAILGVVFYPTLSRWAQAERSFERARLRFATVSRGALVRDLSVEGRIMATSYPTLVSPAQGTVSVRVRAGQHVSAGDLLARVESPELTSVFEQENSTAAGLEAELSSQRVTNQTTVLRNKQTSDLFRLKVETARRELTRAEASFSKGISNQIDFQKAEDALAIAELELAHSIENQKLEKQIMALELQNRQKQLERQGLVVEEARRRVAALDVVAPVSGLVGRVAVDPNATVTRGQEIVTVIDLSDFEIRISIPESYADDIDVGDLADITLEGRKYEGQVSAVSPQVTNALVEGTVVFSGELPTGLKQNQRVSTRIILSSIPDTLTVRRGPFLESGGGRKVYRIDGDMALLADVETGATSLTEVQVISGLNEGDTIVLSDTTRFAGATAVLLRD